MRLLIILCLFVPLLATAEQKPNFIIILTDDQGYNDLSCFGSETIKTPHLDQLAAEGRKFTSFYVPSSVCSPSRAGLLTGCYPERVGMHQHVLFPQYDYGLHPDEYTIADHLKSLGYATACVGKWHLGQHPETFPRAQGFDSYYGIPYSNDMNHPNNQDKTKIRRDKSWIDQAGTLTNWKTPLYQNEEIIELPVDQRTITRRYTDQAINFIEENKDNPFFLYLPHSMPHVPLYVPDDVYDPDPANAYKCVIEHIDVEVGRITKALKDHKLAENTYLIFTSDNGPWLSYKNHGGSALPLRNGKATTFEGGQRVPCIMWAPGRIPSGTTSDAFTSTIDLLPTIAALTNSTLPEQKIDGLDISVTMHSDDDSPRKEFLYYASHGALEGIRQDEWKLIIKHPRKKSKAAPTTYLFNLTTDLSEKNNLAKENPELVAKLTVRMKELGAEVTENARPVWKSES